MKKKIALVTASLLLAASLAGCGNTAKTAAPSSGTTAGSSDKKEAAAAGEVKWPSGSTIYFDVPAKAGGGSDLITRYITAGWETCLEGVNFVVTNYDTSEVGAQHAAKAAPDGMNLTIAACTNMDNYLSGSSEVNPMEDLTVICKVNAGGPQAWIASPEAPYNNMKELAEYIKAHPSELTVGCTLGGTSQLIWLNTLAAIEEGLDQQVNYVQCSSEADKLTNVASKAIDLGNCSVNNALSYQQDGKLKVLGIVGPEVMTKAECEKLIGQELNDSFLSMPEQGINAVWDSGYYIMGPAGMEPALVETINKNLQGLTEAKPFVDGMNTMAMLIDVKDVEGSKADFQTEWDVNYDLLSGLGLMVR
ncbi:MAG: hypothetical protein KH366_13850 [Clostridiaceae bacterium]|nr:hypothetical protein [Clostridiaceae bacterium]